MNNQKRIITIACVLVFLFGIFLFFHQKQNPKNEPISATSLKLNTVVTVTIYDSQDKELLNEAMSLCDKYEAVFSRTEKSSELYKLNHGLLSTGNNAAVLSESLTELISKGLEYSKLSKGAFDIAIEPVSSLWSFTSEEKKVPHTEEINSVLSLVNYEDVLLDDRHLQFKRKGMGLDLGAIAKGFIADKMKDFLIEKGVKSAIIDLGGNVLCIGNKPDGSPFKIGIQKPFADRKETIAAINISDKSVVSSGIYERFFEKNGKLYHHILNPKTGYPYDNSLISVTIISDKSVDGDGLSTSCFALGLEEGMKLIDSLPDVQAVFITDDYELHYSKNFRDEIILNSSK